MKMLLLVIACWVGIIQAKPQTFSELAWKRITPIYSAIRNHPFNVELAKGTLAKQKFAHYSQQDALYLVDFAKVLAALAMKLDNPSVSLLNGLSQA
jgi:thiaminase